LPPADIAATPHSGAGVGPMSKSNRFLVLGIVVAAIIGAALWLSRGRPGSGTAGWEPTRSVELIVPAGTGGGADQMARTIQGIVAKHNLMKQPLVVINKAGGAGGEGFLDLKGSRGNPHKIIITLSNLFTTPLATGIPFNWKDLTPVAMMALDEFILWVNAEAPYKTVAEYLDAVKKEPGKFRMGGTGSKQEDQIITVAIEKATGAKSSASTSTRPSTIRSRRWRNGVPARCDRFACSRASRCRTATRSPMASPGAICRPARARASTWNT
jgi:hypothetical protein